MSADVLRQPSSRFVAKRHETKRAWVDHDRKKADFVAKQHESRQVQTDYDRNGMDCDANSYSRQQAVRSHAGSPTTRPGQEAQCTPSHPAFAKHRLCFMFGA